MTPQPSEQPGPGCIHVGVIESLAPAEPDKHRCRKCYGAVWPEAAAPDPVATALTAWEPTPPHDQAIAHYREVWSKGCSACERGVDPLAAPDPVASPAEAVTLLRRWLSAWRAMELGPPRADLVAATSRFVHSQEATDDLPVATPALDVERLARAIDASWADLLAPLGGQSEGLLRIAEKVAAEYARLGQPVAEDPT